MSALCGTFVSLKTMVDGQVRIVLDMQCTLAEIAAMNLAPGAAFGIARINGESTLPQTEPVHRPAETSVDTTSTPDLTQKTLNSSTSEKRVGPLCLLACTFCADPTFWEWCGVGSDGEAKDVVLDACVIKSRKELDVDQNAAWDFHEKVRKPFLAWKETLA